MANWHNTVLSGSPGYSTLSGNPNRPSGNPMSMCKIFVGNLSSHTTVENLRKYFSKFGEIKHVKIKNSERPGSANTFFSNSRTTRSYGFVEFTDKSVVPKLLESNQIHVLDDGQKIFPKVAYKREVSAPGETTMTFRSKKVFVGGIRHSTTEKDVRAYFEKFGPVEQVYLPAGDTPQNTHKGFGFITFRSEVVAQHVRDLHFHVIDKRRVECKRITEESQQSDGQGQGHHGVMYGPPGTPYGRRDGGSGYYNPYVRHGQNGHGQVGYPSYIPMRTNVLNDPGRFTRQSTIMNQNAWGWNQSHMVSNYSPEPGPPGVDLIDQIRVAQPPPKYPNQWLEIGKGYSPRYGYGYRGLPGMMDAYPSHDGDSTGYAQASPYQSYYMGKLF